MAFEPELSPSMKKNIFNLLIFCSSFLFLNSIVEAVNSKIDIGAGYRQDHFEWELAGNKGGPPVMSRLTWKELRIFDVAGCFKKITCNDLYFRASGDYGRIFHGKNRDSDYRMNGDKVEEYTRFDNNGGEGNVWDASAGMGYFFRTDICPLRLAPLVGYSVHKQNLELYDGYQSIMLDIPDYPGHHFKGLHSKYRALWHGPWGGADLYYHCNDRITLVSTLEYHWLRYNASGHWNLREDFAGDFHQSGYGHGFLGTFGADYNFICGLYMGAHISYNYFHLSNGKDRTPVYESRVAEESSISSGSRPKVITYEGKMKSVKWRSASFIFTIGYHF